MSPEEARFALAAGVLKAVLAYDVLNVLGQHKYLNADFPSTDCQSQMEQVIAQRLEELFRVAFQHTGELPAGFSDVEHFIPQGIEELLSEAFNNIRQPQEKFADN